MNSSYTQSITNKRERYKAETVLTLYYLISLIMTQTLTVEGNKFSNKF